MKEGKIVYINLSSGKIEEIPIKKDVRERFIGGRGLGTYLFSERIGNDSPDPLSEENPVIIATGPLTDSPLPMTGRVSLTTRSPLTGTILDSNVGGTFGTLLKRAGYDAMIIEGKAHEPVYILIDESSIEVRSARNLWGSDTLKTSEKLKEEHGKGLSVISIGPAGENTVRFACVMENGKRAFGRGGAGAVFGSKNLKAIAVHGRKTKRTQRSEKLSDYRYEIMRLITTHPLTSKLLPSLGTAGTMRVINSFKTLGTRNFQKGFFKNAEAIGGEKLKKGFLKSRSGCFGCPVLCERVCELNGRKVSGPEFETLWALGANLEIDDLPFIITLNEMANLLGVDTISLGSVIGFAMELKERGIADLGVEFGNTNGILSLVEDIAFRKERGEILSLGVKKASEITGGREFAMHVKGLELPAYDPRGALGMGLGYATSNRGACHLRGGFSVSFEIYGVPRRINRFQALGKGAHVARAQDIGAIADSLIICRFAFLSTSLHHWARALSVIEEVEYTSSDLQKIGERIFNLERLINLRLGFSHEDDTLPDRIKKGIPLEEMLQEYYEYRGWDRKGIPAKEKIAELFKEGEPKWL
ncbi:MAG: aldehyde ferredoxin oxidoreductase family protein [Synergistetes bacterium]|nr:aldehyde ferredoxin oxidoreductase family protein [Synergistota bacterium]